MIPVWADAPAPAVANATTNSATRSILTALLPPNPTFGPARPLMSGGEPAPAMDATLSYLFHLFLQEDIRPRATPLHARSG